jgi:hypothetical protein
MVLLLRAVSHFLLGCGNGGYKEELNLINIRLDQIEKKLTRLGEVTLNVLYRKGLQG